MNLADDCGSVDPSDPLAILQHLADEVDAAVLLEVLNGGGLLFARHALELAAILTTHAPEWWGFVARQYATSHPHDAENREAAARVVAQHPIGRREARSDG